MKAHNKKIYLASKSPRRRELLRQVGIDFDLLSLRSDPARGIDVPEDVFDGEPAHDYVVRVALEKGAFAWKVLQQRRQPLRPVLTADTTVTIDDAILGKPADLAEAKDMLGRLSGRTHQVLTTVAVHYTDMAEHVTQVSNVRFAKLTAQQIAAYCATTEPYDKAGAYGIQGLAALFIEHIEGSHSGIMGLPIFETAVLLRKAGFQV
ncbi:Maf family protein [Massilia sp. YIM B02769]|uniref:Maf family protein n=1 Tax=Massilia sp. YIM B02769 TaxID=3050129 RepID=UPI0025B6FBD2|nr:Maf family protein [Massilia sp. YIM B02769]MDN4061328.1 Maf family protein [Massilia sp. YIM B02769]